MLPRAQTACSHTWSWGELNSLINIGTAPEDIHNIILTYCGGASWFQCIYIITLTILPTKSTTTINECKHYCNCISPNYILVNKLITAGQTIIIRTAAVFVHYTNSTHCLLLVLNFKAPNLHRFPQQYILLYCVLLYEWLVSRVKIFVVWKAKTISWVYLFMPCLLYSLGHKTH